MFYDVQLFKKVLQQRIKNSIKANDRKLKVKLGNGTRNSASKDFYT